MQIIGCDVFKYEADLAEPLPGGGAARSGFFIVLRSESDHEGLGEIAPLPGFSTESMAEVEVELRRLAGDPKLLAPDRFRAGMSNSVIAGVELATASLHDTSGMPPPLWYPLVQTAPVAGCALLSRNSGAVAADLEHALTCGFNTFKVKMGGRDVEEDIDAFRTVSEILNRRATSESNFRIRLDANRMWDFEDAVRVVAELDPELIDFIEEPLFDSSLLSDLYQATGAPLGLDESLSSYSDAMSLVSSPPPWLSHLVLKPSIRFGYARSFSLASEAVAKGIRCVVSSAYESPIGMAGLVRLASTTPFRDQAAGLGTLSRFRAFESSASRSSWNSNNWMWTKDVRGTSEAILASWAESPFFRVTRIA